MKKIFLLALSIWLFSFQISLAQKTKKSAHPTIPAAVANACQAKYPNMKVTDWDWEADKNLYEAEFKMNGKEMEAAFTPEGKWVKTKTDIMKSQLPAAVSNGISSGEYSTWTLSEYAEIEMPDKGKMYKVKAKKGTEEVVLKYDANGTLVNKKDKKDKAGKMEK